MRKRSKSEWTAPGGEPVGLGTKNVMRAVRDRVRATWLEPGESSKTGHRLPSAAWNGREEWKKVADCSPESKLLFG